MQGYKEGPMSQTKSNYSKKIPMWFFETKNYHFQYQWQENEDQHGGAIKENLMILSL